MQDKTRRLRRRQENDTHLLPGIDGVGLGCGLHGLAVLSKVHETQSQLRVVVDVLEQKASSLVHSLVEAPFSDALLG